MPILRPDGTPETCRKCASIGTNDPWKGAHAPGCPREEFRVMVRTPDRSMPVRACLADARGIPREQAEAIAERMGAIAKRNGWALTYYVESMG